MHGLRRLEHGAEFCRTNTSQLLDVAVIDYLSAGFESRPSRL